MELGCDGSPSAAGFTYDVLGQQATATYNGTTTAYTYNAQGVRTAKTTAGNRTDFLLDGGNVAAEQTDGEITTYLRGVNLIARSDGGTTEYYLYNAHGDVVQMTDENGAVAKTYTYDAFGVEKDPDAADPNPFRYCGEYLDRETGTYYLRARYYAPETGRFTQEDTHWNPANSLYGDEPQKINERTDKLGLKTYVYAPDITAVMQSGNLYAYCGGNPILYIDPNGAEWYHWLMGGLLVAGAAAAVVITAGGITPALCAVGAVASGTAAATTASTVAAGAFVGASIAYGTIALDAIFASKSIDEFSASGNWEVVVFTAGGILAGGANGYIIYSNNNITIAGKGSTGRVEAQNLNEQIAMKQVMSDPLNGATDLSRVDRNRVIMSDPRWMAEEGWVKMQNIVGLSDGTKIVIHFVYNYITGVYDDFKFVN